MSWWACDGGDQMSCGKLRTSLYDRSAHEAAAVSAASRDRKSCDAGDGAACFNAGIAYEHGIGVYRDAARALTFYRRRARPGTGRPAGGRGDAARSAAARRRIVLRSAPR
jgi:TPR repeat protein